MLERGLLIDLYFDDFWFWGERLVILNLGLDIIFCMILLDYLDISVYISLFRNFLIVVYGSVRYVWMYGIYRCDIIEKRFVIIYRELLVEF